MAFFTPTGAKQIDQRLDYDPAKLERLMRAQGLQFDPNHEYNVNGATLITNRNGEVDAVFTDTRVYGKKH